MLLALDTSVIVAGALAGHAFHPRAIVWQAAIYRGEAQAMVCGHALAEVYSVLSKIPGGLLPAAARVLVSRLARQVRVLAPLPESYLAATSAAPLAG